MSFVLDASIAVAALAPDEHGELSDTYRDLLLSPGIVVPPIWAIEVMHVFRRKVHRGAISRALADEAIDTLAVMAVETLDMPAESCFGEIRALSRAHRLNPYDAAYIDAALRTGLPLATIDQGMRLAARAEGLIVLPE
ncbi:MAG: type II toxin-antitoxin system VapC family toxin [Phreatobacter sp.]